MIYPKICMTDLKFAVFRTASIVNFAGVIIST